MANRNRYEVYAVMTTRLKIEIIAGSEEEALLKAKNIDGGAFDEIDGSGDWHIDGADLKEENIIFDPDFDEVA